MSNWRITLLAVAIIVLLAPDDVYAWGPATHIKLASDLFGQLELLPAAFAILLGRHRKDFLFGNIVADVVLAKRLSRIKQFCHHWETGFAIFDDADSDCGRAFGLGYLSHLAADTVAHNKFIPRQMTLTHSTMSFGHVYWELRADSTIGPYYWDQLRAMFREVFDEHEASLSVRLTDTFLPFSMNRRLFRQMGRFVSRRFMRRAMDRWYNLSRWPLSDQLMREYRTQCLGRIIDELVNWRQSPVLHEDPNGNAALGYTKLQRRQLRQMARAELAMPHILYEAAAGHAPVVNEAFPPRKKVRRSSAPVDLTT
ncbi:MAG: zinc dependent phospholipase C family protein [Planctomycetota bacterium]|nr:MAG: zinc dependent phospholipase C family protein [Planctomycetota bacterium]